MLSSECLNLQSQMFLMKCYVSNFLDVGVTFFFPKCLLNNKQTQEKCHDNGFPHALTTS